MGVAWGVFDESRAREFVDNYDGYALHIIGYGSVVAWKANTVEGICLYSPTAGGGHCGGIKHSEEEYKANPWGIWFTSEDYERLIEGRDNQLAGYDISDQWFRTRLTNDDEMEAGYNAEFNVSKF